jgi:hypothetical protein
MRRRPRIACLASSSPTISAPPPPDASIASSSRIHEEVSRNQARSPLLEMCVRPFMSDKQCDRVRLSEDARADKCAAALTDAALTATRATGCKTVRRRKGIDGDPFERPTLVDCRDGTRKACGNRSGERVGTGFVANPWICGERRQSVGGVERGPSVAKDPPQPTGCRSPPARRGIAMIRRRRYR